MTKKYPTTIDGGVFIGWDTKTSLSATTEQVLSSMDSNHIDMALTASFRSLYGFQEEGNKEILAIAKKHPNRIIPMAIVSPFSFLPKTGVMKRLAQQGFKIVGTFPLYQMWPADMHILKIMAHEISQTTMVLQVAVSNWQELEAISRQLGGMDVPVLIRWIRGGGYLYTTEEIGLGHTYKNLYFDVGNLTATGGIRQLSAHLGASRLYFSSNMPLTYERSIYYNVYTEDLTLKDRQWIYGNTLAKLLKI